MPGPSIEGDDGGEGERETVLLTGLRLLLPLVETKGITAGLSVVAVVAAEMTSGRPVLGGDELEESDICLLNGGAAGMIFTSSCIIDRDSCNEDETDNILS